MATAGIDLFVANVDREMYSLYRNDHDDTFDDQALPTGIGKTTILMSGWGLKFFDFDNDGNLDLFLANGHPDDRVETRDREVQYSADRCVYFETLATGSKPGFANVSAAAGPVFKERFAARDMAMEISTTTAQWTSWSQSTDDAPVLLRNTATAGTHRLGIQLVGQKANRDAIGAIVTWQAGEFKRHRMKVGGKLPRLSRSANGLRHWIPNEN